MEKIFKAKRIDNGEWVEFDFNQCSGADTSNAYRVNLTDNLYYSNIVRVDPKTICQATGIKDSEGNRIFFGDEGREIYGNLCVIVFNKEIQQTRYKYHNGEEFSASESVLQSLTLTGHNIHDKD